MATAGIPLWSTTAASNASADPAVNWAEGMAPSAVNDSGRGMMASVAKWRDDLYGLTTAGTSTAFTVTTNATYATASAMSGAVFTIIPNATSGAAPTLAVDGLTARALNVSTGVAVPTGALVSGTPYLIKYVHATTEFIVLGIVGKGLLSALDIINGTSETTIAADDTLPLYDLSATANRRMLVSDFLKVINSLTADGSPDSAADYVLTYDNSASAAKKVLLQNLPGRLPRGYIDGCVISNGTDATNDINIAAGVCRDSTNTVDITVAAMSGKQLDANWAPGAGAGMRNSAAGIADTTYHIYAVAKADGTQDIYAHTSTTVATVISALQAETGGADYLYARHIMSIVRASSAIKAFHQYPNGLVYFDTPVKDGNGIGPDTAERTLVLASVPTGIAMEAIFNGWWAASDNALVNFYPVNQSFSITSLSGPGSAGGSISGSGVATTGSAIPTQRVVTDTAASIHYRATSSGIAQVWTLGFVHPRGKDA